MPMHGRFDRDRFDEELDRTERWVKRGIVGGTVLAVAILAALVFVAVHFLAKVW